MLVKLVLRNLKKRPFLNLVKVVGLALALTCIVFIALFLKSELSFDSYHSNAKNIYRLTLTNPNFLGGKHFARIPNSSLVKEIRDKLPNVESYVRLEPVKGGVLKYNKMNYQLNQGFICDSTFLQVFDAQIIVGNKKNVFDHQASMLVSESYAKQLFGDKNPLGQIVSVPTGQYYDKELSFTVNGVFKDFPSNSHFHPQFLTTPPSGWEIAWAWSYLKLASNTNINATISKISKLVKDAGEEQKTKSTIVYLQALTDIHLHSNKFREIEANGNVKDIYLLAIAAIVLLLIAITNYINLGIGMTSFNAKLFYLNRVLGSSKQNTLLFFFIEGVFIVTTAILISLILCFPINKILENSFKLQLFNGNAWFFIATISIFFILSLMAGMQTAIKSTFSFLRSPAINDIKFSTKTFNKSLMIIQYAVSIALIVSVITIGQQNNLALNKGIGVNENNVFCFESVHANVQKKFDIFKSELLKHTSIDQVSAMLEPPGGEANDMFPFEMEGYTSTLNSANEDRIGVFPCDHSLASLFNLKFLGGENFSAKNKDTEGFGEYIINRTAMHRLNHTNADEIVGKEFKLNFMMPGIEIPKGKIIGVVEDFHISSIKSKIEPLVLFKRKNLWLLNFVVSYKTGMKQQAQKDIAHVWSDLFPEYPLHFEHVSAMYKKVYKTELLQAKLLTIFTVVALLICSMGLLSMSLLITQYRIKEIGIRKVNGAKVSEVLAMLNKDYVRWISIAFVIACPIAYYAMNLWLESFAYKTELSWWIFALAGISALAIALITVSWQSWKAATRNPVEALRYE